jgi:hypothetical protein
MMMVSQKAHHCGWIFCKEDGTESLWLTEVDQSFMEEAVGMGI